MSAHAYTEDQVVGQPAVGLCVELGWATVSALEEASSAGWQVVAQDERRGRIGVLLARGNGAVESRTPSGVRFLPSWMS
jgi:type I restriction enzyme R subunit